MKLTFTIASLFTALALSACGGGSSTGSPPAIAQTAQLVPTIPVTTTPVPTPASSTQPVPATTPSVTNPINPYTGQPASGTPTMLVSGLVVSNITVGATVTAYAIRADGSNGTVLGISSVTGPDGKFTMRLSSAPVGMVRFVAKDGLFISEADGSTQANTATELVTPFITSDLNFFVISPATHIVSHLVSYHAKKGSDLIESYLDSYGFLALLNWSNEILVGDWFAGINYLKTVPGSVDDTHNTYQDFLTAIEWFGVRYDLPSNVVVRIFASHAEERGPIAGVDGSGAPINVGKWMNGVFDEAQPMTLDELTARHNSDGTVQRSEDGKIIKDHPESMLAQFIRSDYIVKACNDPSAISAFDVRYPYNNIFNSPSSKTGTCDITIPEMADLKARIATNNRSK